jgi:hypothetical protein
VARGFVGTIQRKKKRWKWNHPNMLLLRFMPKLRLKMVPVMGLQLAVMMLATTITLDAATLT